MSINIEITSQQPFCHTFTFQGLLKILLLKGHGSRCHISFCQVQDICKIHIDDVLKDISETVLIELPEDHVCSVQHLLDSNKVLILIIFHSFWATSYFDPPNKKNLLYFTWSRIEFLMFSIKWILKAGIIYHNNVLNENVTNIVKRVTRSVKPTKNYHPSLQLPSALWSEIQNVV